MLNWILMILMITPQALSAVHPSSPEKNLDTPISVVDIPITYNKEVQFWIRHFQTRGRRDYQIWLSRSTRYSRFIRRELQKAGLPKDIMYTAMIESGFSPYAKSHASAVGLWQFIKPTAQRYGLKVNWWLDERRNFIKSTRAAIRYKKDLFDMFDSWQLVAAGYNCGERRISRIIRKYQIRDFWQMSQLRLIPKETSNYVPKIIAATLIAKSPKAYGFDKITYKVPHQFDRTYVPGGTDLYNLALYLGVSPKYLKELNPELIHGFVPSSVKKHLIHVPKGSRQLVKKFNHRIHAAL